MLHKAVVAACDALDGVKDGVLENPTQCKFDPAVTQCKGADGPDCLTAPQVEAAQKDLRGRIALRERTSPFIRVCSRAASSGGAQSVGAQPVGYARDFFKYIVFKDDKWEPRRLNFDSDIALTDKTATGLNAVDADLTKFVSRGGKLLIYHGWSDPGIPPQNAVNYYQSVLAATPDKNAVRESVRAFMVPGMGHCGGGEGTSTFDMVAAVDRWVETNVAPTQIPASRVVDGQVVRTRPLCAYPQTAVYKGTGSTDDAANFRVQVAAGDIFMHLRQLGTSSPPLCLAAVRRSSARSSPRRPAAITVSGPVALTERAPRRRARLSVQCLDARPREAGICRGGVLHPGHGAKLRHPARPDVERERQRRRRIRTKRGSSFAVRPPRPSSTARRSSNGRTSPKDSTTRWTGSTRPSIW